MELKQHYGGAIWTNHALDRLQERLLSQDKALQAFQHPDKNIAGKQPGTREFQKWVGKSLITIIAKKNEEGEWIILSCWVDPPLPGSIDIIKRKAYERYKKAGFWERVWIDILRQIGVMRY